MPPEGRSLVKRVIDDGDRRYEKIIEAVCVAGNETPLNLPSLYDTIDPDNLEAILEDTGSVEIRFDYAGYNVTVDSDTVMVREAASQ